MVNCTNSHLEEEENGNEFNSYRVGKKSELKGNTPRSKHSETEQRRRSKINQRFQALRDLIPQNDQKRDKASLLLEAIEYIQFLHEKLQVYEGSYQGWSGEPTKLIPWRSHNMPAERFMDHSQVIMGGSGLQILSTEITNAQNSVESDLGTESTHKVFASDMEYMVSQAQLLQYRVIEQELTTESKYVAPSNTLNEPEEIESASSTYSQGILDSLTQAMQSSGVDLSKASISVKLDVSKRSSSVLIATTSSSKDELNPLPSNHRGVKKVDEDSEQAHKRLRVERS